jgi:iron complex outermembrane recepter protein
MTPRAALVVALAWPMAALGQTYTIDPVIVTAKPPGALTVPSPEERRIEIEKTPGAVEVVPSEAFRDTRVQTIKDMLDFTPGVFSQHKFGEDSRLSIRGSGLSRNFHLRGLKLLIDGVPVNLADGSGDFAEVDPLSVRHVEVFKGANALQFGASSLGGAINFVSPTGRESPALAFGRAEAGSFGFQRFQLGSAGARGPWDYYVAPSFVRSHGFRDQTEQMTGRFVSNVGYRPHEGAETRFYFTYTDVDQEVPSSVSRNDVFAPKSVAGANVINDHQRNIQSARFANKTTFLLDNEVQVDLGAYYSDKQLFHPIFQVIDNKSYDYGLFGRASGEGRLFGFRNETVVGANLARGVIDNKRFVNVGGSRGAMTFSAEDTAANYDLYVENRFYMLPPLALVLGGQLTYAERVSNDLFLADGNDTADKSYIGISPKVGLLWQVDQDWQVFGNVSRSFEAPTFAELNPTAVPGFADLSAQRATTVEIGTRGRRAAFAWDVAFYRAWIDDELLLFADNTGATFAVNANRTIHQGIELGGEIRLWSGLLQTGAERDELRLRQAYTYSDFRFDGDPVFRDNRLPGAPEHYYRAQLEYRSPLGFRFGPDVEWVPRAYFADNANTLKTSAYAIFGFRAAAEVTRGVELFLDARNLADTVYISNVSSIPTPNPANQNVFFPGDGRAVYVGVVARW